MSYSKQNFSDGDVLHASHLNHIEDGIVANETAINAEEAARNAAIENQTVRYDVAQALSDEAKARARANIGAAGAAELSALAVGLRLTGKATGSPASVTDGADGVPCKVSVAIEPEQDLHGYDKPWVGGSGKNLLNNTAEDISTNGITFKVNADGSVTANGTASRTAVLRIPQTIDKTTDLILSGCPSGGSASHDSGYSMMVCNSSGMNVSGNVDAGSGALIPASAIPNIAQVQIIIRSGTTVNNLTFRPMIRLATETDPTYEPYSNICPITGYDAVEVVSTGKNLFDKNSIDPTHGYLVQPDGLISSSENYRVSGWIRVAPGEKYTVSNGTTRGQSPSVAWYDKNRNLLAINNHKSSGFPETYTAPAGAVWMRESVHVNDLNTFMLEHGETASAYEPYTAKTLSVNLSDVTGSTVYGGTLTVNEDGSGELVADHRYWTADGSVSWTKGASDNSWSATAGYNNDATTTGTGWCNYFNYVASWSSTGTMFAASNRIFIASGNPWNTLEEVQAAFAANPLQVVYPLAAPLVYTFTAEQMTTLLGTNNVFANCGAVTVTYARDLATVIQNLEAAISALTPTTTETTETE